MGVAWRGARARNHFLRRVWRDPRSLVVPGFADFSGPCLIATSDDTGLVFPSFPVS